MKHDHFVFQRTVLPWSTDVTNPLTKNLQQVTYLWQSTNKEYTSLPSHESIQRIKCQICSKLFPGRVFPARKQRALVSSDLKCKFRADLPSLDLPEVLEAQFCADSHRRRLATSIKLGPKSKLGAETSCWTRPHKYYIYDWAALTYWCFSFVKIGR